MTRALDLFNIQFEERRVLVDTTRSNQREGYSPDQLVYSIDHTVSEGSRQ
jgi:hypothetical protein